jgi:Bacteriophage probable baseplate hub protein
MNGDLQVLLEGTALAANEVFDVVVERELDQPDFLTLSLSSWAACAGRELHGSDVEVKAGDTRLFQGEIAVIEPSYTTSGPGRLILRALGRLHTLARGTRSLTWANCSEKEIVDAVAQRHGLSVDYGGAPPTLTHEHVYQANVSDLAFLRQRARRIGYHLFVDGDQLRFRKPDFSDSGIELKFGDGGELWSFRPRLAAANPVGEVRVRAWSVADKKEVVGRAGGGSPLLGACRSSKVAADLLWACERTVASKEEADKLASALLMERQLAYVSGHAEGKLDGRIQPGVTVKIQAGDRRFDGRYWVTGVTHAYIGGRPSTRLRFCRDGVGDVQAAMEAERPQPRPAPRPTPPPAPRPRPSTSWIEVRLVGEDGEPVAEVRYRLKLPDGSELEGTLGEDGLIRVDGIDPAECELTFPELDQDAWAPA